MYQETAQPAKWPAVCDIGFSRGAGEGGTPDLVGGDAGDAWVKD